MNPVDEVDDLLTRAGARWRADQDPPPEPDLEFLMSGGRKHRRWVPALAAASVAAVAAGVIAVLPGPQPTTGAPQTFAHGNQAPYDDLLVRDGDRVEATGQVVVEPGKDPVFCPRLPRPVSEQPWLTEAPVCPAQYVVKLKNLDLDKLTPAKPTGTKAIAVTLTGTWSDRTIDVRTQTVPKVRSTTAELSLPPDQVPCPAPAGGWSTKPNVYDKFAIDKFITPREDQANDPQVLYPKGRTPGAPEVYTIGVAHGDLAAFRTAFQKVYGGNLCVHRVKFSKNELTRIGTAVFALIPKGLGVYGGGPAAEDKVGVSAVVYDDALKTALTPIGLDNLDILVAIRPLR